MNIDHLSPAIRDQVERILAYTPPSELYAIPTGNATYNPVPRVSLKWLESGLLTECPVRAHAIKKGAKE